MEPSFKRQQIWDIRGQKRRSPGYDGHGRSYDPASLRQPPNSNSGATYNSNHESTKFYGAVNVREGSANFEEAELDDEYESGEESYEEEAPEADMAVTRQKLDNKLKSTFEAIFEKYGKDFSGVGDEIDLRTGEIIVDNGHVAKMHDETDAGEEREQRGRGMLRAFTEEPENTRLPQRDVEDFDDEDDEDVAHEDTDRDYHVRGRQMLRAFTQEPEFGQDAGTEEDGNEYDGDTSKLNTIEEDDSDDDDILYQSSGVIPAKSMAPPPRPPLHRPYQPKPQSRFNTPKPLPRSRLSSSVAAYPSEPDILAQFGQELGPRIAEYVSRQTSVDEGSIDPKWRTPALPAATAGKRPILKSIILQPDVERSPSPNGNSLWAPEKKPRRRKRKADTKDQGPSGDSEMVVRDRTVISRERITKARVSSPAAHHPESARTIALQNPPQQDLVKESDLDADPFGDNEPGNSASLEESGPDTTHNPEPVKVRRRRPWSSAAFLPRNKYTDAEDKQLLEWAKWVYHETDYALWGVPHWELLSKKNPRHSGTAFRQRYRKLYDQNGGRHPFLEPGMADEEAPTDSSEKPDPPTNSGATARSPILDQATEGPPFGQHTFAKTMMAFQEEPKRSRVQPRPPIEGSSVASTPRPFQELPTPSRAQHIPPAARSSTTSTPKPSQEVPKPLRVRRIPPAEGSSVAGTPEPFQEVPKPSRVQPMPPAEGSSVAGTPKPFQGVPKPSGVQPMPPAEGSSVTGTPKPIEAAMESPRFAAARFKPFKEILHELYVVEGYSLAEVMSIMELQHKFTEHHSQYRKHFREWDFKKAGQWWDEPQYAGITREEALLKRRREKRKKKNERLKKMGKEGVPLPTPDPDEAAQTETHDEGRAVRLMRRLEKKGQLLEIGHSEIEQSRDETGEDQDNDDSGHLSERWDSYDLSRLLQGASDYISPNSEIATGEYQTVQLPEINGEHNHEPETNHTGRNLRSRVIPNSQSSQVLTSPSTSQAKPVQAAAPMVGLSGDGLDPSYMFSDEEDEAAPVFPQTHTSNPQASSTTAPSPKPKPLGDPAPSIAPPAQEPQCTPTKALLTEQPDAVTTSVEIKDEPQTVGRGLGDIYALPRSPPRLPTAPQAAASGSALCVVITQSASSSPLTSPAARTPTPPTAHAASFVSKETLNQSPVPQSTPRRSQTSLLRLSSTPTPRRILMERSTSRPRLATRSRTGSVRSRSSMTPISRLSLRSPLRHDAGEEDEDDGGETVPLSSRRSRAVGDGISSLSPQKGDAAGVSVSETPTRRSGDGDLFQTPGGAWRRCGESGYKCGRGFCFRCSVGGEGGVGV